MVGPAMGSQVGLAPSEPGDLVPRPDPTLLTTTQLIREVTALKELIYVQFEARDQTTANLKAECERRLEDALRSSRKAEELRDEKFRGIYAALDAFKDSINQRLAQNDIQTEKAARDVKSAVDAAFAASKEAVSEQNKSNALSITKSEAAFTKSLDQLGELVKTMGKSIDDKIEVIKKSSDDKIMDIKDRLVAMESRTSVSDPTTSMALRDMSNSIGTLRQGADVNAGRDRGGSDTWVWIFAVVGGLWGAGSTIALLFHAIH